MMNYFATSFNPSVNRLVNECLASLSLEFELLNYLMLIPINCRPGPLLSLPLHPGNFLF